MLSSWPAYMQAEGKSEWWRVREATLLAVGGSGRASDGDSSPAGAACPGRACAAAQCAAAGPHQPQHAPLPHWPGSVDGCQVMLGDRPVSCRQHESMISPASLPSSPPPSSRSGAIQSCTELSRGVMKQGSVLVSFAHMVTGVNHAH